MQPRVREQWREFKQWPPGRRFALFNEAQRKRLSKWQRALLLIGTLVSLAIGVVLVFIPGPAVVFFALAAALLAAQSAWIARRLDAFELWLRRARHWVQSKRKHSRRRAAHTAAGAKQR